MKIAVTGAAGHIGANLCRLLIERGNAVRALIYRDRQALEGLPLETVAGDLLEKDSLTRFLTGASHVIHLAARISIAGDPDGQVTRTNVQGTRNLVEACLANGVRRLVHFSSVEALEQRPLAEPMDEARPFVAARGFIYARSKAAGEAEVLAAVEKGLNAVVLNPTAVLGPFDFKPSRGGQALLSFARGPVTALIRGGFNWVDARDVAAAAIAALDRGESGSRFLLSGHWASLAEIARLVRAVTGHRAVRVVLPVWLAKAGLPFAFLHSKLTGREPLYTRQSLRIVTESNKNIRHEKAGRELGFTPRPLEETIADTLLWFNENL